MLRIRVVVAVNCICTDAHTHCRNAYARSLAPSVCVKAHYVCAAATASLSSPKLPRVREVVRCNLRATNQGFQDYHRKIIPACHCQKRWLNLLFFTRPNNLRNQIKSVDFEAASTIFVEYTLSHVSDGVACTACTLQGISRVKATLPSLPP